MIEPFTSPYIDILVLKIPDILCAVVVTSKAGEFVCVDEASRMQCPCNNILRIPSISMSPPHAPEPALVPSDASLEVGLVYFHEYVFLHEK